MAIQLGSAYGKVELDAQGVKKGVKQSTDALDNLQSSVSSVFAVGMGSLAAQGIGQLISGIGDLYSETKALSSGFESQMAIMSTAVDPTVASMETLHDAAIAVGGDITLVGIDAQQSAGAMTDLFKSGLSVNDVFGDMEGYMAGTVELGGRLRASVDLQAASALDLAAATSLVNETIATYGLTTEDATDVTDNFVQTADASQAEVEDLAAAHQNAATTIAAFGYSLEDTNTALALLSQNSLKGADAGTSLKSMLNNMLRPTAQVKAAWDELGIALYDNEGQLKRMPQILGELVPALQNVTTERRNELVYLLAGSDGQRAMNILLQNGATGWREMEGAIASAATAQEVAAARADTLQGAQESLEGTLETLKIEVGEQFIPVWTAMIQGFTAFADEHGPRVVEVAGKIADVALRLVEGISSLDPVLVRTVTQMTAMVTVLGAGTLAYSKITSGVAALAPVFSEAVAGMQLMASGATAAEVASLGWAAALGPLVVGLAAVAATVLMVNKAIEFHREIEEQTVEVSDQWAEALNAMAAEATSATDVLATYNAKQAEIGAIYDQTSPAIKGFIDDTKILNARGADLNRTLIASASSYDDYRAAAEQVNAAVQEQATYIDGSGRQFTDLAMVTEHSVEVVDAMTFALQTGRVGANESAEAWADYSKAMEQTAASYERGIGAAARMAAAQEAVTLTAEESVALHKSLTSALGGYNLSQTQVARAEQVMGTQLGVTTQLAGMQKDAFNVLAASYADGTLSLDEYRLAGEAVMLVNADTPEGYRQVADVVAGATGQYNMLGASVRDLPAQMASMSDAATAAAATAEEMSQRAAAAWETFAGNVRDGVGAALEAYKSGNSEMLAEQQAALAQMLVGQTNQMLALGQITDDQAMAMKTSIADEFGIVVDDTQLATDALLGLYADWAAGGQTSADQIVAFIQNIGTESETLAAREEAAIQQQMTAWQTAQSQVETSSAAYSERVALMGEDTMSSSGIIEGGMAQVGGASDAMAGQVVGASDVATGAISRIGDAIENLPIYKEIEIHVIQTGDDSTQFGSPQLRLYYGIQDLVEYAATHPVEVAVGVQRQMDGATRLDAPGALLAAASGAVPLVGAVMAAPATSAAIAAPVVQRSVTLEMPVTIISDAVDVEMLTQRVVAAIRSHQ